MTWLDFICIVGLLLVAAGGYTQGLIRGILRLAALILGGLLGAGLMLRLGTMGTPRTTAAWAAMAALLGIGVSSLMVWSATRAVPRSIHESLFNRILGVVPALVAGAIIIALGLSLVERIAIRTETRQLIRSGVVTGPLTDVVDLVEQRAAGLP